MRTRTVVLVALFGVAAALIALPTVSCGKKDTPMFSDAEKTARATGMIDKYVAAWNKKDPHGITTFYADYAKILVPTVGTFNAKSYKQYLQQLFGPIAELSYQATDREVHLIQSETAGIKFRAWVIMRSTSNEYVASKTWIDWQLNWTADDEWKVAVENGTDKLVVKDQLLTVLSVWINGWETKTVEKILSIYTPDATIIESDGTQYDLSGYGDLLTQKFTDIDTIDLAYLRFHLDTFAWDEADVSFQLLSTINPLGGGTAYSTDNISWRLAPSGDNWLVQRQQTDNVSVTDDDTAADDDTIDDDTTVDDDASDDDTTDDDTVFD